MKILCIGDIVGDTGVEIIKSRLGTLIKEENADFVIANGENAYKTNGITKENATELHYAGIDIITTGNHAFTQSSIYDFFDDCNYLLRPLNTVSPYGNGYTTVKTPSGTVGIINLIGQHNIEFTENPFAAVDHALKNIDADCIFVDFHAEATSEKKAMGFYLDGRVSCVFGTHTHVQTADETILDGGTAYITDVGMTGASYSVIGLTPKSAIKRFTTSLRIPAVKETRAPRIDAIAVDTEKKTIKRIQRY